MTTKQLLIKVGSGAVFVTVLLVLLTLPGEQSDGVIELPADVEFKNVSYGGVNVYISLEDQNFIYPDNDSRQSEHWYRVIVENNNTEDKYFKNPKLMDLSFNKLTIQDLQGITFYQVIDWSEFEKEPGEDWYNISYKEVSGMNVPKKGAYWYLIKISGPRYTEDKFNITLNIGGQDFFLDPDFSACGTFTGPGVYTQTANISATGTCHSIIGDTVTVNLDGFTTTGDGTGYWVSETSGDDEFSVENGTISGFAQAFRFTTNPSIDLVFRNVTVHNLTDIVTWFVYVDDSLFDNVTVYDTGGIVFGSGCDDNNITNSTLYDIGGDGASMIGGSNTRFEDNLVYNCSGSGFKTSGTGNVVIGNIIYDNSYGVYINSNTNNLTDNLLYGHSTACLAIIAGDDGFSIGNEYANCTDGASMDASSQGWTFENDTFYNHSSDHLTLASGATSNFTNVSMGYNSTVGIIQWADFDVTSGAFAITDGTTVYLEPEWVSVDDALTELASSADVYLLSPSCTDPYVLKKTGFPTTQANISENGSQFAVADCTDDIANFSAAAFSGYTLGAPGLNLSLWNGSAWIPYVNWMEEGGNWCYQEATNVSNQSGIDGACSLTYTGTYAASNTGGLVCSTGNLYDMYDGNMTTGCSPISGTITLYSNYTKPDGIIEASNLSWRINGGPGDANHSITTECFAQTPIQFKYHIDNPGAWSAVLGQCWNGTAWDNSTFSNTTLTTYGLEEEAMWWYGEDNDMAFRCSSPPSICQPTNQNNATSQAILRNHNNATATSTYQAILGNTTWATAELRCGTSSSGPATNTNVTTSWANYSTSNITADSTQGIYCFLNVTSVPADFPRDFNLTVRNH